MDNQVPIDFELHFERVWDCERAYDFAPGEDGCQYSTIEVLPASATIRSSCVRPSKMAIRWLDEIRIDDGRWIERAHPDGVVENVRWKREGNGYSTNR